MRLTLDLSFEMSRSLKSIIRKATSSERSLLIRLINLDSNIADVSDQKFLFDIDSDGVLDNISELGAEAIFVIRLKWGWHHQ